MKRAYLILKCLIAIAVLVMMAKTAVFVTQVQAKEDPQEITRELKEKLEQTSLVDLEPGEKAFNRARQLLSTGNFAEGRDKLLYIVNFHPSTRSGDEARRILGEMNLDRIFSLEEMANKKVYKVKSGDSILKIANREKTNLDVMMLLNNLTKFAQIHPGDEFIVMELGFRLEVHTERELLSLWKEDEFIKQYRIQKMDLDEGSGRFRTKIAGKSGYHDGRRYSPNSSKYRTAAKVLGLSGTSLQIRGMTEDDEGGGQVIYLTRSDMEELAMLLRVGNEVVIRYTSR